jgi:dTDP-4-amino-4,6-dideoxygalactose transaminase
LERLDISRDTFIESLREQGIQTSVHFIPVLLQPFFDRHRAAGQADCPRALELFDRSVSLPLYPGMTDQEAVEVVRISRNILDDAARKPLAAAAAV